MERFDFNGMELLEFGHNILIGGVIYSGKGKNYVCLLPDDADFDDEFCFLQLSMEEWKKVIRQTDLMETEILQKAADGTMVKALVRKTARMIEQGISWRVYKRDGYKCRYCGKDGPLTVDHLILWEEGGPSIEENLVTACKRCNKTRGSIPYKDWLEHPYYLKVSKKLDQDGLDANIDLVDTLVDIPIRIHVRSR